MFMNWMRLHIFFGVRTDFCELEDKGIALECQIIPVGFRGLTVKALSFDLLLGKYRTFT